MDIVLRQNGSEVGRFGLTTNKSDTQTNDVIKIVKDGTTYYGRLTSDKPNTTRKLKVTKNGSTLYLQTDPVGLRWAGTLSFTKGDLFDPLVDTVVKSNVQYPKGVYKITISNSSKSPYSTTFTVEEGGIGNFRVKTSNSSGGEYIEVWCGNFKYYKVKNGSYILSTVKVEKIG